MENVAHSLLGLALARTGLDRRDALVAPTLVLAANLPDIDTIGAVFGGKTWYLIHHRGLTHGALGIALQIPLFALLVHVVARWAGRRARLGPLLAASALGLISHPLLDALNTYGVRPFIPFDWTWYYGDVAFILDPWLWLLFGAAACLGGNVERGTRRARHGDAAWLTFGLLAASILFAMGPTRGAPRAAAIVWAVGAAIVAALRVRGLGGAKGAGLALGLSARYLAGLCAASRVALHRGLAEARGAEMQPTESSSSPQPMIPWRFDVVAGDRSALRRIRVDLLAGTTRATNTIVRNLDDPVLRRPEIVETPEYEAWRRFARHPYAAADAEGRLVLGDARYEMRPVLTFCSFRFAMPER